MAKIFNTTIGMSIATKLIMQCQTETITAIIYLIDTRLLYPCAIYHRRERNGARNLRHLLYGFLKGVGWTLGSNVVKLVVEDPAEVLLGVVAAEEDGGGVPVLGDVGLGVEGEGVLDGVERPSMAVRWGLGRERPRTVVLGMGGIEEDCGIGDDLGLVSGIVDAVDVDEIEVVVVSVFAGGCYLVIGPIEVGIASVGLDFDIAIGEDGGARLEGEDVVTQGDFVFLEVHNLPVKEVGEALAFEGECELFSEIALVDCGLLGLLELVLGHWSEGV
ncbi:MAG: hypothetical protein Q4D23_10330 [Bacteroidales bacterium]|nr:hypothetical protein [Bacteroidales bacterium]